MKKLTIKQKIVYEAIEWFINQNGYSPTIREISNLTKTSVHAVFEKILVLEKLGYISTVSGKPRTIKILRGVDDD